MWTFTLFLIGFLLTLFLAIYSRCSNGSRVSELLQTRCYEIIPVRALLWLLVGVAIECGLLFLYLLFKPESSISLLVYFSISAVSAWLLQRYVIAAAHRVA